MKTQAWVASCLPRTALAGSLALLAGQVSGEPLLERAIERGTLNVCTADEFPPFKRYDSHGQASGLIYDLIVDLQHRLSTRTGQPLKLELVQVTPLNRLLFLNQGRCELLVTSLLDTPARRREVDFAAPGYYSSAATVFAAKHTSIDSWEGLRGKTLCAPLTSVWVRPYEARYGIEFISFSGLPEMRKALLDGRCVGALGDDVLYRALAGEPQWQDFEVKLPGQDPAPWGIALRKDQPQLRDSVGAIVRDWHASGYLIDLEHRYGLPANPWLAEQHQRFATASVRSEP
ncbi:MULTISPECIES: transporter substrate-binding domain-containing protein [Pseudomonas]|uniref:transporter substrate-binding domain-containing protein n=1 Tax=Pseudomonas TaxID=286 RepID=UPI000996A534|nr:MULTISPECIES: transporter substrate-binding domain-containing protein [Pseudomonas]MBJ7557656.1 transporter substrate-binding domain-containing protein [Pseudomonas sp. P20]MBJ7565716.1 transporter substrate-binding domain-containing protein [Pseudomonas sp. P22]MBM2506817.1 transporter substrate-binding domain-containing protein [Pseudomonas aeruginosa]MBM2524732.1 transporter substrate-binding domain-containing protein [Pseudomonas aeruginosa]MBM2561862.1 transporter substrate-binding dom